MLCIYTSTHYTINMHTQKKHSKNSEKYRMTLSNNRKIVIITLFIYTQNTSVMFTYIHANSLHFDTVIHWCLYLEILADGAAMPTTKLFAKEICAFDNHNTISRALVWFSWYAANLHRDADRQEIVPYVMIKMDIHIYLYL